ncbi:hypothetical protein OGR47_04980 [Methylocystis sp. MJC1]|jgi:hypothetical protein|uniref:hypothetical protein n=1 Tax=Methylocystis sp. MJC1 TaxID=2654282 RepID=UPI0013E9C3C6|nr:hypothetical protein [Methylocystis sp. MJC1]KAF2989748.1 hypothetical protein MJC1_03093 [Methylocystis sp. MJC1]MBU6526363.1 hypothetical protein [Methylocystis sp. MJC1]UZX12812.1 hypothetical protein OGR47_04980 [Methylocystis sp. MJC1]
MSKAPRNARSFEMIDIADLHRLADIAHARLEKAFVAHPPKRALYDGHLLVICLCQGAADHFLAPTASDGVQDFDMWAFFRRRPGARLWNRKPFTADFGPSRFDRNPLDPPKYAGRRVDVLWRDIPCEAGAVEAVTAYFRAPQTESARALRKRAAVVAWPSETAGFVIWRPATG